MTNIIYKFTKDKNGNPIGVVCAHKINEAHFGLGWAKLKKGDKFNKQFGLTIAKNRAITGSLALIPHSLLDDHDEVGQRAGKYFKNCAYFNPKAAPKGFLAKIIESFQD